MKYKKDIEEVKRFIHTKPWRKKEFQKEKWNDFLYRLSKLHKVKKPTLSVTKFCSCPEYIKNKIILNKYSIISLLHEFGHHIGLDECQKYSENVFLTAYPIAKSYLKRDSRGYLVKKR